MSSHRTRPRDLLPPLLLLASVLIGACSADGGGEATSTTLPPTSTVAAQTPQTSTPPRAVEERAYAAAEAFPQLDFDGMLALHWVPGSATDAVVVTQDGMIYRADLAGGGEPAPFLDVRDMLIENPGTEEGLLGFAFAPDFASSGTFYIHYTAGDPRRSIIARYRVEGAVADPASAQVVLELRQPFANHNGGALVFGPDGYLYIGFGDGGSGGDPLGNGQSTDVLLGKILRIDVSSATYTVPPDNPFAQGGGAGEIWAYGLRNPWRFSFDRKTGQLWAGDVGQGQWEEIDRIVRGGNYGWNIMEGPECFRGQDCDRSGLELPRAAYTHDEGCSVTGGYVYRGASLPELDGWYVYGDYCSGLVWAFDAEDDAAEPVLLIESGKSITSFAEAPDGELYLVTFDGAVYQLSRR